MKRLVLVLVLALILRPVYGFSYASELTNENETSRFIANITYEGKEYLLYNIYDNNSGLMILQDSLDNLIKDNETIKNVFYKYRLETSQSSQNETIENPRIASEKDFDLLFNRIQEKTDNVVSEISEIETMTLRYQSLILNLSSQGAYASKSIELFSELQDFIWQSKVLLFQNRFNSADGILEDAKRISPEITLDIRSSFKVNEGSLALDEVLSLISDARRQGFDVNSMEDEFNSANSLLTESKNDYINGNYDSIDSKIDSVLEASDKISREIENLKAEPQVSENVSTVQPTGLMIKDYSWVSYALGIAIVMVAVFLVYRRRTSKFNYHYKRRFF